MNDVKPSESAEPAANICGPERVDNLQVTGITVLVQCSDGGFRLVALPIGKGPRLLNFIRHQVCGGVLTLSKHRLANPLSAGGAAVEPAPEEVATVE